MPATIQQNQKTFRSLCHRANHEAHRGKYRGDTFRRADWLGFAGHLNVSLA